MIVHIYIINLKNQTARRAKMEQEIQNLCQNATDNQAINDTNTIYWHFFQAIESSDEVFASYKTQYFSPYKCYMLHGRILSDNEIACYASHYEMWKECVKRDEPIIVLEDDVGFEPCFLETIQTIAESNFAFVRLYYMDKKRDKYVYQIADSRFYYSLKNTNGMQGYYLTPKAARAFLKWKTWDSPVDIQMEFVSRNKIDNIIYKPFCIFENQYSKHSTINRYCPPPQRNLEDKNLKYSKNLKKLLIPYKNFSYKIIKPFYRTAIQLRRALFKITYSPPKFPPASST